MFERRSKIFLVILVLVTLVLLVRVMQIQVLGQEHWEEEAVRMQSSGELLETVRGRLLDRNRNPMAVDAPCIDAAVDYRAVLFEPEPKWLREVAAARVRARLDKTYLTTPRPRRIELIDQEEQVVAADIKNMWEKLAVLGGLKREEMDELRRSIIRKVDIRRRRIWYLKYQRAVNEVEASTQPSTQPAPWYQRWLLDDSQEMPELDEYFEPIAEEREAHVVLTDLTNATNNYLGKNLGHFPGLELRPSVHRTYPYGDVAAHVIGRLGKVAREDVEANPSWRDELRGYELNDLMGRTGLEALCESVLRGTRGKIEQFFGEAVREERTDPVPGRDVMITLDMELQREIQRIFRNIELTYNDQGAQPEKEMLEMPGAAVLLDVKTNQVLALVSYPSYNLNEFDQLYPALREDLINRRLTNRATQFALEPGSTVKPIVGLAAITDGHFGLHDTVECTGYLVLGGRQYSFGRCWTMSAFGLARHVNPYQDPHPNGHLTFSDGLQRSCNVFFETLGDRLGIQGLHDWYYLFGLGRRTGLGIAEEPGMIPTDPSDKVKGNVPADRRRPAAWFSSIGQDRVLATPIQMANVAATIARDGIWMRPRLLMDERNDPQTPADRRPDWVDLKISPEALVEAKRGMVKAVNTLAGTGASMRLEHLTVAGKTGSAQAAALRIPVRDADGKLLRWDPLKLGTHREPNPDAPWYRGWGKDQDRRSHAWVIGFVPAEDPKLAFAVMVEYGGGGGATAGWVAHRMLEAAIEHGYLPRKRSGE